MQDSVQRKRFERSEKKAVRTSVGSGVRRNGKERAEPRVRQGLLPGEAASEEKADHVRVLLPNRDDVLRLLRDLSFLTLQVEYMKKSEMMSHRSRSPQKTRWFDCSLAKIGVDRAEKKPPKKKKEVLIFPEVLTFSCCPQFS